jgi:hypothetical protein
MRIIVEAFKDTLELGLQKHKQVVVRIGYPYPIKLYSYVGLICGFELLLAHDSDICFWMANWE